MAAFMISISPFLLSSPLPLRLCRNTKKCGFLEKGRGRWVERIWKRMIATQSLCGEDNRLQSLDEVDKSGKTAVGLQFKKPPQEFSFLFLLSPSFAHQR
jgi:hypothetical protein